MDMIFTPEIFEAAKDVLTALGGLLIAARPVAAAFTVLARLTPMKWDDAVARGLFSFINLFTPKGK